MANDKPVSNPTTQTPARDVSMQPDIYTGAAQIATHMPQPPKIDVVEVKGGEPGQGIDYLYITVEADTAEAVLSQAAKQRAWQERKKHGMHNAGIEGSGGPYPVRADNGKAISMSDLQNPELRRKVKLRYRHTFRLTQAVI